MQNVGFGMFRRSNRKEQTLNKALGVMQAAFTPDPNDHYFFSAKRKEPFFNEAEYINEANERTVFFNNFFDRINKPECLKLGKDIFELLIRADYTFKSFIKTLEKLDELFDEVGAIDDSLKYSYQDDYSIKYVDSKEDSEKKYRYEALGNVLTYWLLYHYENNKDKFEKISNYLHFMDQLDEAYEKKHRFSIVATYRQALNKAVHNVSKVLNVLPKKEIRKTDNKPKEPIKRNVSNVLNVNVSPKEETSKTDNKPKEPTKAEEEAEKITPEEMINQLNQALINHSKDEAILFCKYIIFLQERYEIFNKKIEKIDINTKLFCDNMDKILNECTFKEYEICLEARKILANVLEEKTVKRKKIVTIVNENSEEKLLEEKSSLGVEQQSSLEGILESSISLQLNPLYIPEEKSTNIDKESPDHSLYEEEKKEKKEEKEEKEEKEYPIFTLLHTVQSNTEDPCDLPHLISSSEEILLNQDETLLDKAQEIIKKRMHHFDKAKYPNPPYEYHRYQYQDKDEQERSIVYITYNPNIFSTVDQLKIKEINSIAVRKLGIIGGILTALEYGFLGINKDTDTNYPKLIKDLVLLAQRIDANLLEDEMSLEERIAQFYHTVTKTIVNSNVKTTAKINGIVTTPLQPEQILKFIHSENNSSPEFYFCGEYKPADETLIVKTIYGFEKTDENGEKIKISTYQIDFPWGQKLTDELKKEYQKIHNASPPQWFTDLDEWEQNRLRKLIPETNSSDNILSPASLDEIKLSNEVKWRDFGGKEFERKTKSAILNKLPGVSNVRTSYLYAETEGESKPQLISCSVKTGVYVPFEMEDGEERERNTQLATQQILNEVISKRKESEEKQEGIWDEKNIAKFYHPKIVYVGMLLSDVRGIKDFSMVEEQSQAIEKIKALYPEFEVLNHNEPINSLGKLTRNVDKWNTRWDVPKQILSKAHDFLEMLESTNVKKTLTPIQIKNKNLISKSKKQLENMQNLSFSQLQRHRLKGRNDRLFKSALLAILAEAMGWPVLTNCKSGKDRTGIEEIYRHAMLLYFEETGELPSYTDVGEDRKRFVQIFVKLFNNMKISEVGAAQTPGILGVRNGGILDEDIVDALGDEYKQSVDFGKRNRVEASKKIKLPIIASPQPTEIMDKSTTLRSFLFEKSINAAVDVQTIAQQTSRRKQLNYVKSVLSGFLNTPDTSEYRDLFNQLDNIETQRLLQRYEKLEKETAKFKWGPLKGLRVRLTEKIVTEAKSQLKKEEKIQEEFDQVKDEIKKLLNASYEAIGNIGNLQKNKNWQAAVEQLCQDDRPNREAYNLLNRPLQTAEQPFSEDLDDYLHVGKKTGGANLAGPLGGEHIICHVRKVGENDVLIVRRGLIKQNTNKSGEIFHHKTISEFVASGIMNLMNPNIAAKIMFVHPGGVPKEVSKLSSKATYEISQFPEEDSQKLNDALYDEANQRIHNILEKIKSIKNEEDQEAEIEKVIEAKKLRSRTEYNQYKDIYHKKLRAGEEGPYQYVYNPRYRIKGADYDFGDINMGFGDILKNIAKSDDPTQCTFGQLAQAIIASLLVGDFDVHTENLLVIFVKVQNDKGEIETRKVIIRIDLDASFKHLKENIHLFTGMREHFVWFDPTNHFLEFVAHQKHKELYLNPEFLVELINQGIYFQEEIYKSVQELISKATQFYDDDALLKYARHIISSPVAKKELKILRNESKKAHKKDHIYKIRETHDKIVQFIIKQQTEVIYSRQYGLLKLAAEIELFLAVKHWKNNESELVLDNLLRPIFLKYPDYFNNGIPNEEKLFEYLGNIKEQNRCKLSVQNAYKEFISNKQETFKKSEYFTDETQIKEKIAGYLLPHKGMISANVKPEPKSEFFKPEKHKDMWFATNRGLREDVFEVKDKGKNKNAFFNKNKKGKFSKFSTEEITIMDEKNDKKIKKIEFKFYPDKKFELLDEEQKMLLAIDRIETLRERCKKANRKYTINISGKMNHDLACMMEKWCEYNGYEFTNTVKIEDKETKMHELSNHFEKFDSLLENHPWVKKYLEENLLLNHPSQQQQLPENSSLKSSEQQQLVPEVSPLISVQH